MANITNNVPHVAGFNFGQFIMNSVADFKASRARRAVYKATFQALSDMTDKDLADIGVSRLSIRDISLEAARLHA